MNYRDTRCETAQSWLPVYKCWAASDWGIWFWSSNSCNRFQTSSDRRRMSYKVAINPQLQSAHGEKQFTCGWVDGCARLRCVVCTVLILIDRKLWNSTNFKMSVQSCFVLCCSYALQYLLCIVQGRGQQTKEIENKNIQQRNLLSFTTSSFY